MEPLQAFAKLSGEAAFISWKDKNEGSFPAYAFAMADGRLPGEWQLGYYVPGSDKIITFIVGDAITIGQEAEAFKDSEVLKLDLEKVRITAETALSLAETLQKEKYPAHLPSKKIIILQSLPIGQVWNITYVTQTFNTLNIKLDSGNGEVLKDELLSIFQVK